MSDRCSNFSVAGRGQKLTVLDIWSSCSCNASWSYRCSACFGHAACMHLQFNRRDLNRPSHPTHQGLATLKAMCTMSQKRFKRQCLLCCRSTVGRVFRSRNLRHGYVCCIQVRLLCKFCIGYAASVTHLAGDATRDEFVCAGNKPGGSWGLLW